MLYNIRNLHFSYHMAAAITALYFVAYLPWYLLDRKAKTKVTA